MAKIKTYVITLSKKYLKGHPKAGSPTHFKEKFLRGEKIHTIRGNYLLWEKRIKEVQEGKAIISIRQWEGMPYRSKQEVIKDLTLNDLIGIQILDCDSYSHIVPYVIPPYNYCPPIEAIAANDGLDVEDFYEWFDVENLTGKKAIIHFTKFRY